MLFLSQAVNHNFLLELECARGGRFAWCSVVVVGIVTARRQKRNRSELYCEEFIDTSQGSL